MTVNNSAYVRIILETVLYCIFVQLLIMEHLTYIYSVCVCMLLTFVYSLLYGLHYV